MTGTRPAPRILVTRAAHQASSLADHLRRLGAEPVAIPAIQIVDPADGFAALDLAVAHLDRFHWLVLTSVNGVEALAARLRLHHAALPPTERLALPPEQRPALPPALRLAAIGNVTTRAMAAILGVNPASILVPSTAVAESLADTLMEACQPAQRVLLVRAETGRDVLPATVALAGCHVTLAQAYRTQLPADSIPRMQQVFHDAAARPEAIAFTSAQSVRNTLQLIADAGVTLPAKTVLASIGPVTSAALREAGLPVSVEASSASTAVLATELVSYLRSTAAGCSNL